MKLEKTILTLVLVISLTAVFIFSFASETKSEVENSKETKNVVLNP